MTLNNPLLARVMSDLIPLVSNQAFRHKLARKCLPIYETLDETIGPSTSKQSMTAWKIDPAFVIFGDFFICHS